MKSMKPEKNITIFIVARTESSRTPKKIIRKFANEKSLFEIMCRKMSILDYPCYAAVGERELIEISEKCKMPTAMRKIEEVTADSPLRLIFKFLERCETSHAMLISPCTPFLEPETINQACEYFLNSNCIAMTSVIKEQNWYFNEKKQPLFPIDVKNMNSKDLCIYALANAFELFPVKRFTEEGIYYTFSDKNDPYLYEISKLEAIDINTEDEFMIASRLWSYKHGE